MSYQGYTLDPTVVKKLKQQLTNQRNNVTFADGKKLGDYWTGGAGTDWATTEMVQAIPETDDFDDWFNWTAALLAAVNPRVA